MSRSDVTDLGIQGTWIDGYLPGIQEIKAMIESGRHPSPYGYGQFHKQATPQDYCAAWTEDIRLNFDRENLTDGITVWPCFTWFVKIDKQPEDARAMPLYEEYLTDPRKEDYCHVIAIHGECPLEEDCLQHLIQQLNFELRPDTSYADPARFKGSVRQILADYVSVIGAPQQWVTNRLKLVSHKLNYLAV
jgi:hypothetical protein